MVHAGHVGSILHRVGSLPLSVPGGQSAEGVEPQWQRKQLAAYVCIAAGFPAVREVQEGERRPAAGATTCTFHSNQRFASI